MSTLTNQRRRIGFERVFHSANRADTFTIERAKHGWVVTRPVPPYKRRFFTVARAYAYYFKSIGEYSDFLDSINHAYTQTEMDLHTGEKVVL
jgi:hypothetical protein